MKGDADIWLTDFQAAAGEGAELISYRLEGRAGRMLRLEDGAVFQEPCAEGRVPPA